MYAVYSFRDNSCQTDSIIERSIGIQVEVASEEVGFLTLPLDDGLMLRERSNTLPGSFAAVEVGEAPLSHSERCLLEVTIDGARCTLLLIALILSLLRVMMGLLSFYSQLRMIQHVVYMVWSLTVLVSTAFEVKYLVKVSDHCPSINHHSITAEN